MRDPAKLLTRHERLQVVTGSGPDDTPALEAALRGRTVVISALGRGTGLDRASIGKTLLVSQ